MFISHPEIDTPPDHVVIYLLRGFFFFPLMRVFPGNNLAFWLWSGAICAIIGIVHGVGIKQAWPMLSQGAG